MIPTLLTPRLVLRAGRLEDAEALHALWSDVDAMRWWSHPPHDDLAQSVAKMASMLAAEGWRCWVVTLRDADRAIGTVNVHAHREGVAEIGYGLARAHWGGGLAREAVAAVLDYLFATEGHRRVFADTDPDNAASNALLRRLGFREEGRLRDEWQTHIGVRDALIWGLLRGEWMGVDPPRDGEVARGGAA